MFQYSRLILSLQDAANDVTFHVSQPEVAALELVSQLRVVDSQAVENGGL